MQHTSLSLFYLRCARYLIELYPVSWRERYSEEMLLLLTDYPPTFRTIINLIFHLFDAYSHPYLLNGRFSPVLQRMRSSELTIYSAAVTFFFAWSITLNSAGTLESYSRDGKNPLSFLFFITPYIVPPLVLLILLGGLPILLATSRMVLKARKYHVLFFLCLCLMVPVITIFLAGSFVDVIGIGWVWSLFFISLALSQTLIYIAIQNVAPSQRVTHLVLYLATPLPLVMLVGCVLLLSCILSAFITGDIALSMINEGFFFWFSLLCLMLLIMGVACSFSLFSLLKGFRAKWDIMESTTIMAGLSKLK